MIRLRLLSRPDCPLCEEMRSDVETILAAEPHEWEIVDVDSDPALAKRWGDQVPVLFVNGHLFAKIRLPQLAPRLRIFRMASRAT